MPPSVSEIKRKSKSGRKKRQQLAQKLLAEIKKLGTWSWDELSEQH